MKTNIKNSKRESNLLSPTRSLEGDHIWTEELMTNFLIRGQDTQGQATLLETIQKKGLEPALHQHPDTDETFYIIEGKLTFFVDDQTITAPAGATVFIRRGQEHTFRVDTEMANTLILLTPAAS